MKTESPKKESEKNESYKKAPHKKAFEKRNRIKKHQEIIIYFYFVANKTNLQADLGDL